MMARTIAPRARVGGARPRGGWAACVVAVALGAGLHPGRADEPPLPAASVYERRPRAERPLADTTGGTARTGLTAGDGAGQGHGAESAVQAERIVAGALGALGRAESFSAHLRQKARIGERVLVGTGRYVQSGQGEEQRFRFESTLECDTESFASLEVCDGLFCWNYRRDGADVETLRRFDVRRVRDHVARLDPTAAANPAPYLGGLQRSLWMLRQWFRFIRVDVAETDGVTVWVVEGRWDPTRLTEVLPQVVEAAGGVTAVAPRDLPDGVPWSVRVVVGQSDLLVRRVEWLAIPGTRPVIDRPVEPIAVLDLFDIQLDGPVDAAAFFYQPATTGLIDFTEEYVKRLEPMRP